MWEEILLTLSNNIFEYGLGTIINSKERKIMQEELNKEIHVLFIGFSDSSIDTDEFFELINSYKFTQLLHNYFYTLKDGMGTKEYKQTVIGYILHTCSKAQVSDVNDFFNQIEILYSNFLYNKIEKDPKLNALFQLLTVSQRSVISKLSEGIDEIIKNINSSNAKKESISNDSIKDYHRICENEYGIIRFTGISGAERKAEQDINTFYVENKFSFYNVLDSGIYNTAAIGVESICLKDLFNFGNKIVIVGAGGYGKTTSLNYLYCNYENLYDEHPLKIKIDLKEYAEFIIRDKKDILSCIADQFYKKTKRNSGLEIKDIEMLLSDYLESGRCLVIFDALDEISTQDARSTIRTEVANFCELYYINRFIITTREVGYLKNKFDNSFVHFKINQFTARQIRSYSKNWFKYYCTNTIFSDFKEFWKVFSDEVNKAHCKNLIANPIMLILALVIFDTNQSLPSKKVEFYEKCIATFLSERQIQRGLQNLSLRAQNILGSEMVIPRVAHFKYNKTNENNSYQFTTSQLKESMLDAIEVSDRINWVQPVDEYIRYLIERTELICEVDEDLLDFAHKTFYEYFLAVYFSKQLKPNLLQRQLLKWIGDANNHELAKLIIEIIILKGEPYRQDEIVGCLFNSLKTQKPPKKRDLLHLLIELYDENILPPKYHSSYYENLLINGSILRDIIPLFGRREEPYIFDKFDVQQLAILYSEKIKQNEEFYKTIETIYYFNDSFSSAVIEKNSDSILFENVTTIFSFARAISLSANKKEITDDLKQSIKYFDDQYFVNHAIDSPLIFVSLIRILVQYTLFSSFDISKLLSVKKEQNDYFYRYSLPSELIGLIDYSKTSKELFALLLILLILFSEGGTNVMIGYVLKLEVSGEADAKETIDFTKWIYQSLNCEGGYIAFEDEIKRKGLFSSEYDTIYENVYNVYRDCEAEIEDERIVDYFESIDCNE